jgi:glycosyltransferase involved in cell wall biosynthesis
MAIAQSSAARPDESSPAVARAKRILFVETTPGTGGSVTNVLYPMVTGLDRERFTAVALFYWPNPYQERLEQAGVQTLRFDRPRRSGHPQNVARLQAEQMAVFETLRARRRWWRDLYHAAGSYLHLAYSLPQIRRLAQIIRQVGADLVHLNRDHATVGRQVVLAARLAGVPSLCYAQNFSVFHAADRQIAGLVDHYVFCSQAIGRHCQQHGGVRPGRGVTIYPGVAEAERWAQPYDVAGLRRSLGWSPDAFVVGNIGRLVAWKGQDVFLRALAEVKREAPSVRGLIVGGEGVIPPGGSAYAQRLVQLTQELGLTDHVHFAGFQGDIPPWMAAADVLVHSSTGPEPFATTVIEGMLAARPVVAMNAGGMPEMVSDGVTGLLAPPRDPSAMAEAILTYWRDRERARQMGLAAQQAARARLTAARHIREFQALYERALRR